MYVSAPADPSPPLDLELYSRTSQAAHLRGPLQGHESRQMGALETIYRGVEKCAPSRARLLRVEKGSRSRKGAHVAAGLHL